MATTDLQLLAERRAAAAAVLGWLLLSEPGSATSGLSTLVGSIPALAALVEPANKIDCAEAYERLLLRRVPPYESIFRSGDGQRGGEIVSRVAASYERVGYDPEADRPTGRPWRVAGIDHLGLELRCYAHLCAQELLGWRDDHPDRAARAVETERQFLADHLATWADVALAALSRASTGSLYEGLFVATAEFLAAEYERLRPAPVLPGAGAPPETPPARTLGPARLSRLLLAPAQSGAWIDVDDFAVATRSLGLPWRPAETRSSLRSIIEAAADADELPKLLTEIVKSIDAWTAVHDATARKNPGVALIALDWRHRATSTTTLLEAIIANPRLVGHSQSDTATVTLDIWGPSGLDQSEAIAEAMTVLRSRGLRVELREGT